MHFEYLRMICIYLVSIDLIFTFNLKNITNFNFAAAAAAVTSLNIAKGRKRTPQ